MSAYELSKHMTWDIEALMALEDRCPMCLERHPDPDEFEVVLSLADIHARVMRCDAYVMRDKDDLAHIEEDNLMADTLRAIANGAPNAVELARAALATTALCFARWHS